MPIFQLGSQDFPKPFLVSFINIFLVFCTRYVKFIFLILIIFAFFLLPLVTYAAQAILAWDASSGSVSGYKMYYGTRSGDYDYNADVGNSTSCTISGLKEGTTYYFAVTAYNDIDGESDFSEEISHTISADDSSHYNGNQTLYENAEDLSTRGWKIYDNSPSGATIKNVYDHDRGSRVIQHTGTGTQNGFRLRKDDGSKWQNSTQFILQWNMKYSENFTVYVDLNTTAGHRYIYYQPDNYDGLGNGEYVHFGLGRDASDGRWHAFDRDLQADLADAQPNVKILQVNGFLIRGSGKLDDIYLLDH